MEYFSFGTSSDGGKSSNNVTQKKIPKSIVNQGLKKGVERYINDTIRKPYNDKVYDGDMLICYFTDTQLNNMINYASQERSYDLTQYNCVKYVQGILRSGGFYSPDMIIPNKWHPAEDERY